MNIETTISQSNLAFIVGAPRSGTTLLMSILNSHPDIHIVPEFKFYLYYLNKYKKADFRKKEIRNSLLNDFTQYLNHKKAIEPIFENIIEIDKNILNQFIESNQIVQYDQAVKILYCSIVMAKMKKENPKVILEKNPAYTQHIPTLLKFKHSTKFIGIIRNYKDAISSRISSNERKNQNIQYYTKYWDLINKNLYQNSKNYEEHMLIISYNDLIHSPQQTIDKCVLFLNLDSSFEYTTYQVFYKNLLTNLKQDKDLAHKERWIKKFGDLSRPINATAISKWKERLTTEQVLYIDQLCQKTYNLFFNDTNLTTDSKKGKNQNGYYKAILNYLIDDYRFLMPPGFNIALEKFVRKSGII